LRSGGDHFDPEVAVRVRRGTLRSFAVEVRLKKEREGEGRKEAGTLT